MGSFDMLSSAHVRFPRGQVRAAIASVPPADTVGACWWIPTKVSSLPGVTPARLLTCFLVRVAPFGGPADASPSGGPRHSPAGGRTGQRSRPKAHREQTTFTWWWASVPSEEGKLGVCYHRRAPGASGQHFAGQCLGESVTAGTFVVFDTFRTRRQWPPCTR